VKLLILGGTKFLGRAVAEAALERGHELTLFNRGETNAGLFPQAEHLRGNRDGDLTALEGRHWDVVIDTSGYVPRVVRASAELIATDHYQFVSTISVYAETSKPVHEDAAVKELDDPATEDVPNNYGELKIACERVVAERFPDAHTHVRPGLIVGPHDPTDRFTYWPVRVARGGEVLVPGRPERQVQFVDARDLGDWMVRLAENRTAGTFNATGPVPPVTMGNVIADAARAAGSDATFTWVDEQFLLDRGVEPWMELPLWVPETDPDAKYFLDVDVSRATATGLTFRPVEDTVRDTLAWVSGEREAPTGTTSMGSADGVGLDPGKERRLLDEWRARA
jgi:2'-hydroxyisoflavone reductase